MSGIYLVARDAMLTGQLNTLTDALTLQLVGTGFTYNEADVDLTAIGGRVGTAMPVSVTEVQNGEVHCEDVLFVSVTDGTAITGILTYLAGVDDASSTPIGFTDLRADGVPLALTATGGDLNFTFVDYLLKI